MVLYTIFWTKFCTRAFNRRSIRSYVNFHSVSIAVFQRGGRGGGGGEVEARLG